MSARPSLRAAINAKCRECIYDPLSAGNWKKQVEACSSATCPLHPLRPFSNPRTRQTAIDAITVSMGAVPCAVSPKNSLNGPAIGQQPHVEGVGQ
jgi:hypothetical protein